MILLHVYERIVRALVEPIVTVRARRLGTAIAKHVQPGGRLLDVGCGDLYIGDVVAKEGGVTVHGLDVRDQNRTHLPIYLYDGGRFPFPDDSYDTVLFSFVLHHCENQDALLAEARRVSRSEVILLEDTYDSPFGHFMTKVHDVVVNKLMYPSIACPFTYRTPEGWRALFRSHRFDLVCEESIVSLPRNVQRQVLFRIRKTNVATTPP